MQKLTILKKVRGVMTRFEPLTEEFISEQSEDGLTYSELSAVLSSYGLDIRKVVHDPTRQIFNTYYTDYDQGKYAAIFLQRQYIQDTGQAELRALTKYGGICPELAAGEWKSFYLKCVPMAMLIYDFQRRYRDIPREQVFSIWHDIYKRIDYANDMWPPEVLEYVFQYAPPTPLPRPDADGRITIYRGMGTQSLPPERAISWSSHPGNALWFANRSGQGTRIAVAHVKSEQIIAYFPGYSMENEVVVLPGTISDYGYEDMIPAAKETVPQILAPTLAEFQYYGKQARLLGYQEEALFQVHGLKHILRVLLLSLIYIHNAGDPLSEADRQILIYFSLLHDIGRTTDDRDDRHGEQSVVLTSKKGIRLRGIRLSRREYRIAELVITHHCHDDITGVAAIMSEPGLSRKEKERVIHLYYICKDMDGLDRVRFNGLDYRMLRTAYAKRLPLVAGCLLEEDILAALDMEIPES